MPPRHADDLDARDRHRDQNGMKVSRVGSTTPAGGARRTAKTGGTDAGGFKQALVDSAGQTDGANGLDAPAAINAVDTLLAVQEADATDEREARRRLVRRGEDILDRLEDLRRGMVTGTLTKTQLEALARTVRERRTHCADPRLGALMDEIELRAEVELAKLSRAP
jgi:hypothetical protein